MNKKQRVAEVELEAARFRAEVDFVLGDLAFEADYAEDAQFAAGVRLASEWIGRLVSPGRYGTPETRPTAREVSRRAQPQLELPRSVVEARRGRA